MVHLNLEGELTRAHLEVELSRKAKAQEVHHQEALDQLVVHLNLEVELPRAHHLEVELPRKVKVQEVHHQEALDQEVHHQEALDQRVVHLEVVLRAEPQEVRLLLEAVELNKRVKGSLLLLENQVVHLHAAALQKVLQLQEVDRKEILLEVGF